MSRIQYVKKLRDKKVIEPTPKPKPEYKGLSDQYRMKSYESPGLPWDDPMSNPMLDVSTRQQQMYDDAMRMRGHRVMYFYLDLESMQAHGLASAIAGEWASPEHKKYKIEFRDAVFYVAVSPLMFSQCAIGEIDVRVLSLIRTAIKERVDMNDLHITQIP